MKESKKAKFSSADPDVTCRTPATRAGHNVGHWSSPDVVLDHSLLAFDLPID
jgi:hypothetical protein